jgi:hypothetical protein
MDTESVISWRQAPLSRETPAAMQTLQQQPAGNYLPEKCEDDSCFAFSSEGFEALKRIKRAQSDPADITKFPSVTFFVF